MNEDFQFSLSGTLTQESFNNVFNEDKCVFVVITRLFQTAKGFTAEIINPVIRLILSAVCDSKMFLYWAA